MAKIRTRNQGQLPGMDVPSQPQVSQQAFPSAPSGPYLPGSGGGFRSRSDQPPEQLPMFMSASQVMQHYQPLEGDRQDAYDPSEGEITNRSRMTATHTGGIGRPNPAIRTRDEQWLAQRHGASAVAEHSHYRDFSPAETDSQVWARKLDESHMSPDEYAQEHGGSVPRTPGYETLAGRSSAPQPPETGGTSAWDAHDYNQAQYVQEKQEEHYMNRDFSSLHSTISEAMSPGGEGFTQLVRLSPQFGTSGKPQVAGGHHRLAIMNDIQPERLLPVLHTQSTAEAKAGAESKYYKYT